MSSTNTSSYCVLIDCGCGHFGACPMSNHIEMHEKDRFDKHNKAHIQTNSELCK